VPQENEDWEDFNAKTDSSRRWRNHKGELALLVGDNEQGRESLEIKEEQTNAAMRESINKRKKISAATEQHTEDPVAEAN
jgi:hypothetical protein